MICRLCQTDRLLCKSHIIPEFCYKPLYDKDHRFIEVTDVSKGHVRRGQKGIWERLLCADCEALLCRLETSCHRMFFDPLPVHVKGSNRRREVNYLDYKTLKLFCLSILWRGSISKDSMFKYIDLGPHEEIIRNLILSGDPNSAKTYPVLIYALHFNGQHMKDILVEPTHMMVQGCKCYRFVMSGFVIFIFVAKHSPPKPVLQCVLSPSSPLHIYDAELGQIAFLSDLWERVAESTKDVKI